LTGSVVGIPGVLLYKGGLYIAKKHKRENKSDKRKPQKGIKKAQMRGRKNGRITT
jgi:Sec-independent protein secretion pathway component TatC